MKGLGYAEGRNLMVVRDEYLDDPLSEGTLAHELTHIQDARQLLGRTRLPSFLAEGRALVIGHAYRMALGQRENSYDARMAASAATFSAEDAGRLLRDYRGAGWDNKAVGTFLVEYMRVGWNGGTPDVLARLSRMVEAMGGGEDFDAAFRKEFGRRFGDLRRDFARFLDATKGEPEARLEGTMWRNAGRRPRTNARAKQAFPAFSQASPPNPPSPACGLRGIRPPRRRWWERTQPRRIAGTARSA